MNAWHCDRVGCDSWTRAGFRHGFLEVAMGNRLNHHFCSWDCLMVYAATKQPLVEVTQ